jgi:hypothetical protein
MRFFRRRLILVGCVVLAVAAALACFYLYQNYAREKQNAEILRVYKLREEQQRKFSNAMRAHQERALIKKSPLKNRPAKSPESP